MASLRLAIKTWNSKRQSATSLFVVGFGLDVFSLGCTWDSVFMSCAGVNMYRGCISYFGMSALSWRRPLQTWTGFPFFFLEYLAELLLIFACAPGLRPEVEGDGNGDGLGARVRQVRSLLLLSPCKQYRFHSFSLLWQSVLRSNGAAGHNRGGVVERRLPARTQGRTVGRALTGGADCILTSVQVSFKTSCLHS